MHEYSLRVGGSATREVECEASLAVEAIDMRISRYGAAGFHN